jgi:hypothetical protein
MVAEKLVAVGLGAAVGFGEQLESARPMVRKIEIKTDIVFLLAYMAFSCGKDASASLILISDTVLRRYHPENPAGEWVWCCRWLGIAA